MKELNLKSIKKEISISSGNSKLGKGVFNVSTLPGDKNHLIAKKDGTILCHTPGTCNGMCETCFKYCYARNPALRYPDTREAWEKNTILLRSDKDKFYNLIKAFLGIKRKVRDFRWNVSGEIETYEDLERMNALALECNTAKDGSTLWYGVYTKQYGFVLRFLKEHGHFAPNFVVNVSAWHNLVAIMKMFADYTKEVNIFAYDDGQADKLEQQILDHTPHCRAVGSNHKKTDFHCADCNWCYRRKGVVTAVYSH